MKKTQQSLLRFYKKSKKSIDETVPSTSNDSQDEDTVATPEIEQIAPSPTVIYPVIEHSLECLDFKFNTGGYVDSKQNLSNDEKVSILHNVWTPNFKFDFLYDNTGKFKRHFKLNG